MTSVQRFAFLTRRMPAIDTHVLQFLPTSMKDVNLTGCAQNLMNLIATCLHGNAVLCSLNLNGNQFVAIPENAYECLINPKCVRARSKA